MRARVGVDMEFAEAVRSRRSEYMLDAEGVDTDAVLSSLRDVAGSVPSSFNAQSARMFMLVGDDHRRFWGIVEDILRERSNHTMDVLMRIFTSYLRGWMGYYHMGLSAWQVEKLAKWARRKLRAILWKQWKTSKNRFRMLVRTPTRVKDPNRVARGCLVHARSHGTWHMSGYPPLQSLVTNKYLESLGFPDMLGMYEALRARR